MRKTTIFRQPIEAEEILVRPSVYDGFSARLVQQMGFKCGGISGAGLSETTHGWADVGILSYEATVSRSHDPAITARGSRFRHAVRVEVFLKDATRLDEQRDAPRAFASDNDIVAKFRSLAGHRLGEAQIDRIVECVLGFDTLPDVGVLTDALAAR